MKIGEITRQIESLEEDLAYWSKRFEEDMVSQRFHGAACSNCMRIRWQIEALRFAISGEKLKPAIEDDGSLYALDIRDK